MMLVYTKLNFNVLTVYSTSWIYYLYTINSINTIYCARLYTLGYSSGKLSSKVYHPCIGGISNTSYKDWLDLTRLL